MTTTATRPASTAWSVWSTGAHLVVTDEAVLDRARAIVERHLAAADMAASRFRPDSEVSWLAQRTGPDVIARPSVTVSAVLGDLVAVALDAARATDGDVDPTLGNDLVALGYDADVSSSPDARRPPRGRTVLVRRPSWRDVHVHGRALRLPAGVLLDLGATAKARTADLAARAVADELGCGVLVNLGGDLRVAGPEPVDGWQVLVQDGPDEPAAQVRLAGACAIATSSTLHRRWRQGATLRHHILDPVLRSSVPATWRTVSVAAATCVEANTLSTAAIVRGPRAVSLLAGAGVAARLVGADGTVTRLGGWPA